jgi:hypothetical protein
MEERHQSQLIQNLIDRFELLGEEQFQLSRELSELTHPVTRVQLSPEIVQRIENAFLDRIQYRRSHDGSVLIPVSMVTDPRGHEEWYPDWIRQNSNDTGSYYWHRLEDFLSRELTAKYGPDNAGRVVRSIDDATFRIMEKISSPRRREFSYKGLTVGYVQSGKTANFTALIAKAADAGYKLIVVLAGIHNVLRRQTQVRLDRELTGVRDIESPDHYIMLPGAAKMWNRLTTARNDFSIANLGLFSTYCELETPSLAVVKKNVSVLNRLIDFVSAAPESARAAMPLLIIDDEADQASIDGNANNPDADPTATNDCIRRLLTFFSKKVYVGYTATPFANVLINMRTEHGALQDDLYPRNFIVSLPEPDGYFGSSRIFSSDLSDRFVFEIPDETNVLVRGGRITDNLSSAIDTFLLSCAVRNLRGDRRKPMSMLVHISHRINDMGIVARLISNETSGTLGYIETLKGRYRDNSQRNGLRTHLEVSWQALTTSSEVIREQLVLTHAMPDFAQVWNELENVFQVITVLELNSSSDDTLDYTTGEEMKVIAVGGNQLSRGLTLEGLMTSYYLRASRQYDTLLQMGRWFGYRSGYEDLTRVYTTNQIWNFFEHLAMVEEELRSEIFRYEEENKTPAELAVAIRDHTTLTVTAPNKMGAGQLRQVSYSDSLNQTIWFPLDQPQILRRNLQLGSDFIANVNGNGGFSQPRRDGVYLSNNKIAAPDVLNFLAEYSFVTRDNAVGPGLDSVKLIEYIRRRYEDQNSELRNWSVAIVGNTAPTRENPTINYGGLDINRIQRSRKYTLRGYNIGVLTESDHLNIDLAPGEERSAQNPLLLLYLVWKDSRAATFIENPTPNQRIDLYRDVATERIDLLGVAVKLPRSQFEPNSFIGQ